MQTKALITYLGEILDDEGFDFWSRAYLVRILNEVRNRLPYALPECTGVHGEFPIVAGALQHLDKTKVSSLIRVESIVDADNKLVAGLTERALQDVELSDPDWLMSEGCGQFWIKHPDSKQAFWLYPSIESQGYQVNCFYSAIPPRVEDADESELEIDDAYESNVVNFVLARAYEREGTNPDKAAYYMQKSLNTLNMSTSIDAKDDKRG